MSSIGKAFFWVKWVPKQLLPVQPPACVSSSFLSFLFSPSLPPETFTFASRVASSTRQQHLSATHSVQANTLSSFIDQPMHMDQCLAKSPWFDQLIAV